MQNIYMLPYVDIFSHEKTAAARTQETYIEALTSSDPVKLASVLSDEDRAFWNLSEQTVTKLANGLPLSKHDIEEMTDKEAAALTLLGEDVMLKVAAYTEFWDSVRGYEMTARGMARRLYGQYVKEAQEGEEGEGEEEEEGSPPPPPSNGEGTSAEAEGAMPKGVSEALDEESEKAASRRVRLPSDPRKRKDLLKKAHARLGQLIQSV